MTERTSGLACVAPMTRRATWMVLLAVTVFAIGCGSDSHEAGSAAKYPTGISEDVEQQLKYDARVDSYDTSGDSLVINVNDAWLNAPPGMQERSVGQWYSLWHANHSGGVEVQHDGTKVATWTSSAGYKPVTKSKSDESHSES